MFRTDNRGVAKAFADGRAAINSNGQLFSPDGRIIYSYGAHWPIAAWVDGKLHVNRDRYGVTTSKHTSYVLGALAITGQKPDVVHTSCAEMCRAVRGHAL